jgi:hypothetical protein
VVRGGAPVLAAILLLSACGESNPEPTRVVAGVAEIQGPYQTEPYRAFDQDLIRSLEEECAASFGEAFKAQPELLLADARGGGRLMLIYGAADGATAECLAKVDPNGTAIVESAGISSGSGPGVPAPIELFASSGGSSSGVDSWSYLHGIVGSDIGRVVIALADGTSVTASVGGGRFAAWWPTGAEPNRILGFDRAGNQVADQSY